jgi:hypothetical protein
MKIEEFQRQPRGHYNFERFIYPGTIDSRLGPFSLEVTVALNGEPFRELVDALEQLAEKFKSNQDEVIQMFYGDYLRCSESVPEFEDYFDTPTKLTVDELKPYIDSRILTVSCVLDDLSDRYYPRVYISSNWNTAGLYVKFTNLGLERVTAGQDGGYRVPR